MDKANVGVGLGAAALATAIAALNQRVKAAAGQELVLDDATMALLQAIATSEADIDNILTQMAGSIGSAPGQILVQGYPNNALTITATRVQAVALNTPVQLPDIEIPNGMEIAIKGWPTNGGTLYLAKNPGNATNINQSWPLLPNEIIHYKITNANSFWFCAIGPPVGAGVAGDRLGITVEQRS